MDGPAEWAERYAGDSAHPVRLCFIFRLKVFRVTNAPGRTIKACGRRVASGWKR